MLRMRRNEFYGRLSSIVKQINPGLQYLEQARRTMKQYPASSVSRTGRFTVAIAGYPNVGKSSLLANLTTAKPKVRNYAFTTTQLNFGYMGKIQFVDTPGAFDRDLDEMNDIEKQAYLAVKYVADLVLVVIDPTESCGYKEKVQLNLAERLKKHKPILIAYSMSDKKSVPSKLCFSSVSRFGISTIKKLIKEHESKGQDKHNSDCN